MTSLFFSASLEERRDSALAGFPCDRVLDGTFNLWLLLTMDGRPATVSKLVFVCEKEVRTPHPIDDAEFSRAYVGELASRLGSDSMPVVGLRESTILQSPFQVKGDGPCVGIYFLQGRPLGENLSIGG